MKYLFFLTALAGALTASGQTNKKKGKVTEFVAPTSLTVQTNKKKVADTMTYDVTVSDSTGIVAYLKKDATRLTLVNPERAVHALFVEYSTLSVQHVQATQELAILRAMAGYISVNGTVANLKGFNESIKAYIDFRTKKQ